MSVVVVGIGGGLTRLVILICLLSRVGMPEIASSTLKNPRPLCRLVKDVATFACSRQCRPHVNCFNRQEFVLFVCERNRAPMRRRDETTVRAVSSATEISRAPTLTPATNIAQR